MHVFLKVLPFLSCAAVMNWSASSPVAAAELIDDAPLKAAELLADVPLVGFRVFPQEAFVLTDPRKNEWALDSSVIYETAANDPKFLDESGMSPDAVRKLPLKNVIKIFRQTATKEKSSDCPRLGNSNADCLPSNEHVVNLAGDTRFRGKAIDADFVRGALANWASEDTTVRLPPSWPSIAGEGIKMNTGFASFTYNQYGSLKAAAKVTDTKPVTGAFEYGKLTKAAATKSNVSEPSAVSFTKVGIGNPQITPGAEKKLIVPKSITRGHDIFWLQLAINPREELRSNVRQMWFLVTFKTKGAETLELVPLRYGQEQDVKEKIQTPEVKIEVPGGGGVSVGEVYGQEVAYKVLKPTIVATGLQTSEFGWYLSDEALDMSAKRLIAIIRVPHGSKKLEFEMVVNARLIGPWRDLLQGETVSSQPISISQELPTP